MPATDGGAGGFIGDGFGGDKGGNGWGGGGDGDGSSDSAEDMLKAAGRSVDSLPPEMAAALAAGKLSREILERYLRLSSSLLGPLMKLGGFRERLLADPSFFVKVGIEVGIGIFTKSSAEYTKRGEKFSQELDFVAANIIMALVADFMLVWLPAPTLSFAARSSAKRGGLAAFLASCPENAFQKVPQGYAPFSPAQRFGAVLRNGAKLAAVGFGSSLIGVSVTNVLITARQMLDPGFAPPNAPQGVLSTSAAYGVYMAVSSNLRYQVIAGVVEQRGIEAVLANSPSACHALSLIVRTSNTFLGSLMWVDWLRFLGLQ
ncbi:hypothetical protein WJX81_005007 [Elliptochloris bilobata]|uniref:Uncharacterized protein n=1 Tax=Elliptochloris bilobata TaxID=381761 RepID=A0AAW1QJX1_9CHLO